MIWSGFLRQAFKALLNAIESVRAMAPLAMPLRFIIALPLQFAAFAILLSSVTAVDAFAQIYRYTDKSGAVVIVDDINKVPPEYKDQVKEAKLAPVATEQSPDAVRIVTMEEAVESATMTEEPTPAPQKTGRVARAKAKLKKFYETPGVSFIFMALGLIAGFILFIAGATALGERMGFKRLGPLISIVITAGVLFYIFTAHLDKVNANFKMALNLIGTVKKQSTKVSDESEKALKESEGSPGAAVPQPAHPAMHDGANAPNGPEVGGK